MHAARIKIKTICFGFIVWLDPASRDAVMKKCVCLCVREDLWYLSAY